MDTLISSLASRLTVGDDGGGAGQLAALSELNDVRNTNAEIRRAPVSNDAAGRRVLAAPLGADWSEQIARVCLPGLAVGKPVAITLDGEPIAWQYTGDYRGGAEVALPLSFNKGRDRTLEWSPMTGDVSCFAPVDISSDDEIAIGNGGTRLALPALNPSQSAGVFAAFGAHAVESVVECGHAFKGRSVTITADGPLFTRCSIVLQYDGGLSYEAVVTCYAHEQIVIVDEKFWLGQDAAHHLALNPSGNFTTILSHKPFDFHGEGPVSSEPLASDSSDDVLCRLQMPPLGEHAVPKNRGWFALADAAEEPSASLGIMGLDGPQWENAVESMPILHFAEGRASLAMPLRMGRRVWLVHFGPIGSTSHPRSARFVFHRLQAEWNDLPLTDQLAIDNDAIYDNAHWNEPGILGANYREAAVRNCEKLQPLVQYVREHDGQAATPLSFILGGDSDSAADLYGSIAARFGLWVHQFQGWRTGKSDYAKCVIGFSRTLRGLLIGYEALRKAEMLSESQIKRLHAWFAFAADRIRDENRWPHSRTWLPPSHPDSVRDFYAYPGEQKTDRLVWTNSLPNFQSDPMCGLLHLAAIIPEHPDADDWRREGLDEIERQLTAYCSGSGAWEESINYALYTLAYFIVTFRIVKNRFGIDYFRDERVRRFVTWLVHFVGPVDKRAGVITFPTIGNSIMPTLGGEWLLMFASELDADDPLRADLTAIYQQMEHRIELQEHGPVMLALAAEPPTREYAMRPLGSEVMTDLGVAMRHAHPTNEQSYLFQKIGPWKDHYEADETAFNWYAKGVPFSMEYGTYTADGMIAGAHNVLEIPDADALSRGHLADHLFTGVADYTRCEMPVNLKLSYGRIRSFDEIDGPSEPPTYFYIGDESPTGQRVWKTRLLMYVKPDYIVVLDTVRGANTHRLNLHLAADEIERRGTRFDGKGRFGIDPIVFVHSPTEFRHQMLPMDIGASRAQGQPNPHSQNCVRIYNESDSEYRTVVFARSPSQNVQFERVGQFGIRIVTDEYDDICFLASTFTEDGDESASFAGRSGWIRRDRLGVVSAIVPDGEQIAAFGAEIVGRGPWHYNTDGRGTLTVLGVPRSVRLRQ